MPNLLIEGTQWGDEGKGKIVDLLTPAFDIVARYQGGHNAGHTVYVKGQKIVLHLIPSGILHPDKLCIIGNGVVINPEAFFQEVNELKQMGVKIDNNLMISKGAHLIFPYHSLIEKILEEEKGERKIGTTCRGIGPAYEDKAARIGIKVGDFLNLDLLKEKIYRNIEGKNKILKFYNQPGLDPAEVFNEYQLYAEQMKKYIKDTAWVLNEKIEEGQSVLFEGAQGTLLDIDQGTYPYVTSSNPTAGGVCTGLGVSPDKINAILGITKAYTTRVGKGPFPTELLDLRGKRLRENGNEFGATTGRPRRCGWFDTVAVCYSIKINGIKNIALTKIDVLDDLEEIKICTGYKYKGQLLKSFPNEDWMLKEVEPQYKTLKGWQKKIQGITEFDSLPQPAKDYIKAIEDLIEAEVTIISTGMERKETIIRSEKGLKKIIGLERLNLGNS
ncbi:MAG: adenylosuccinate synthase [Candidatus Aminicenantia bacterium]